MLITFSSILFVILLVVIILLHSHTKRIGDRLHLLLYFFTIQMKKKLIPFNSKLIYETFDYSSIRKLIRAGKRLQKKGYIDCYWSITHKGLAELRRTEWWINKQHQHTLQ